MRVLLLPRYSRMGASSRLRTLQYLDVLAAHGVEVQVCSLLDDAYLQAIYSKRKVAVAALLRAYWKRLRILTQAPRFDLVWIEKELFPNWPSWFEWLLARTKVPYVVDYDDAIFHNYGMAANPLKRLLKNKIAGVMRHAALVVAGNSYLMRHAAEAGAARVALLPTVIDIRRYRAVSTLPQRDRLVVGWIGSPTTARYLQPLLPVLARLAAIFPLDFTVVGAELDASRYGFVRHIVWHESTEAAEIGRFDIGVMPLPDGPWENGKCGYKLIQYMACAKPVVASPVGANRDIVQHGTNGFLAATADEWFDALAQLLADAGLRQTMGRRGRALAEEKYCLQVSAPCLLQLLESAVK
jgi:glycosyltransferase involved in cell wall biosynthesis